MEDASTSTDGPPPKKGNYDGTPEAMKSGNINTKPRNRRVSKELFRESVRTNCDACVVLRQLPSPFMPRQLISTLNKSRLKAGIGENEGEVVRHCFDYSSKENSVIIEFIREDIAQAFIRLQKIKVQKEDVIVAPYCVYDEETLPGMDDDSSDDETGDVEEQEVSSQEDDADDEMADLEKLEASFLQVEVTPKRRRPRTSTPKVASWLRTQPSSQLVDDVGVQSFDLEDKSPSLEVKITGLPACYNSVNLIFVLHEAMYSAGTLQRPLTTIWLCEDQGDCAIANCEDLLGAGALADLTGITYKGCPLSFQQIFVKSPLNNSSKPLAEKPLPSTQVVIKGLPTHYRKENLLYVLHEAMYTAGSLQRPAEAVLLCEEDSDRTIATCENLLCAEALADLAGITFQGCPLSFEQIFVKSPLNSSKPLAEKPLPSTQVVIKGLPTHYRQENLLYVLHEAMYTAGSLQRPAEAVLLCEQDSDRTVATCEDLLSAGALADLTGVTFQGCPLSFEQIFVKSPLNNSSKPLAEKPLPSTQVVIKGLPTHYRQENLLYVLHEAMYTAGSLQRPAEAVLLCEQDSDRTVATCEDLLSAGALADLTGVTFQGCPLSFEQMYVGVLKQQEGHPSRAATSSCGEGGVDIAQAVEFNCLSGSVPSKPLKDPSQLKNSEEGRVFFLKKLVFTRRLFSNKNNFACGLARLLAEVRQEYDADLPGITSRRKAMMDLYGRWRKGKVATLYEKPLQVIFGGAAIETLEGTGFHCDDVVSLNMKDLDPVQIASTAALFSKGTTFTTDASKYLLKLVRANFHLLKNSKGDDAFWAAISGLMAEKHHYYEASSCENKYMEGKGKYRSEVQRQNRTGGAGPSMNNQGGPLWYWNEDMHYIMSEDVIVAPPVTTNVGSSVSHTMSRKVGTPRPDYRHPEDNEEGSMKIGRSRVPQLKRPKGKKDARAEGMNAVARAIERRTDVLLGKSSAGQVDADSDSS